MRIGGHGLSGGQRPSWHVLHHHEVDPAAASIAWTVTMFGWCRAEAARASCGEAALSILVRQALGRGAP